MIQEILQYLLWAVGAVFVVLSFGLLWTYPRLKHNGVLALSFIYATSGLVALQQNSWLPIAIGFGLAWYFRMRGLDPAYRSGTNKRERAAPVPSDGEK